jgi:prepilin-type N-terminal cleavage/methylation domain-containing protein
MFKKGFTLLEVLIVVIIIGILVAIALPQYTITLEKGKSAEAATNVGSIRTALDRYWYQNGAITTTISNLDIDDPNNITNKLYTYTITDGGTTATTRIYTVTATRTAGGNTYTVSWKQDSNVSGKLLRSANLGGPTS